MIHTQRLGDIDLPVLAVNYIKDSRHNFDTVMKIEVECAALSVEEGYNLCERMISKYSLSYVTYMKRK